MGLPKSILKPKIISREEFFGQYGKILKVKISCLAGVKNSQSANIIYSLPREAALAVLSANKLKINKKKL